jgi:hypothetical protein
MGEWLNDYFQRKRKKRYWPILIWSLLGYTSTFVEEVTKSHESSEDSQAAGLKSRSVPS